MIILALDTCCGRCSVAIFKDSECIKFLIEETPHKQAELAIIMIEQAIAECSLDYKDLDYLTCTVGPGSFTGIRIGIAAIQGINQVIKKKVVGISTLESMGYLSSAKEVMTCLDAGRSQFYCQKFQNNLPVSEIKLISKDEAEKFADGLVIIGALANKELPDAKLLGIAAFKGISSGNISPNSLKPLYIRESDAVEKKKSESKNT